MSCAAAAPRFDKWTERGPGHCGAPQRPHCHCRARVLAARRLRHRHQLVSRPQANAACSAEADPARLRPSLRSNLIFLATMVVLSSATVLQNVYFIVQALTRSASELAVEAQ